MDDVLIVILVIRHNIGTPLMKKEPATFPIGTGDESIRDAGAAGAQNNGWSSGFGPL